MLLLWFELGCLVLGVLSGVPEEARMEGRTVAGLSRLEMRTNDNGGRMDLEVRMDGLVRTMYVHWRDKTLGKDKW